MKTIDEQIWDYIDGTCTSAQKTEIEIKIAENRDYKSAYKELLKIHEMMDSTELEQPSMSFIRNVMEQVNLEVAPISMKTKVDHRIIYSIASFFILSILSVLVYVISNSNFTSFDFQLPSLNPFINLNIDPMITKIGIQVFFFIDIILGLIYLDGFLRKKLQKSPSA